MYNIKSTVTLTGTPSPYTWLFWDQLGEHTIEQNSPEHFDNIFDLFLDRLQNLKDSPVPLSKLERTELQFIFESLLEVKDKTCEDIGSH